MKSLLQFILVSSFVLLLTDCQREQDKFAVKATIGSATDDALVYLHYRLEGETVIDSTYVKDNKFEFTGNIESPFRASLLIKGDKNENPDRLILYIEKGTILLNSADSLKNATISGSELNDDVKEWNNIVKPLQEAQSNLYAEYRATSPQERESKDFQEKFTAKRDSLDAIQKDLALLFIKEHPNSFLALDQLLTICLGYSPEADEAESLFMQLSPQLRVASKAGRDYAKKIDIWKSTSVGAIAPDFTQNDPQGNPLKLSDFRGKYLLLDFWASWCGPCRAENPNVVKAYNAYKDKGFTILGVSLDDSTRNGRENWLKAIDTDSLTWAHVSDLKFWKNEVALLYGINVIPSNFLLDPEGKIIARNLRGDELAEKLAEHLK
ncbi:MAG: AhpC/TSA family protein [Tannerella sp.]|jgi:peroxiredoxin|nr:AhpC/TSA family protein [Tannerella sp.]